ncbi:30S ribosomal protein S4 [Angelakisella massiliensis]|uniref:30S ribosomal protein S4 n=1 Tax=Angelakisella massiliensis TaxID=1871018 RepID=UPI0008F8B4FB|nr:30S ribosomal protein S4 [Angelakisella massiliensis]
MARYTGAVCRLCRREGKKLFLKGDRCYSDMCALTRRASVPGQHGKSRKKVSEYGVQLRAKQSARRYYGVLEGQFLKYFEMAERQPGMAGENLLRILESRLDNVVYRAGFAASRKEARQLVRHGHYTLNGHKANIPSILVKAGDVIEVTSKSTDSDKLKAVVEANASRPRPKWLDVDTNKMTLKVVELPNREDIDLDVEEHLIVELYSK